GHDIGRALNPLLAEGQVEGSVYMGIGEAVMEGQVFRKGVHKNPSLLEYKSPTTLETPEIHTFLIETDDPEGPFGAKEAGQGPLLPVIPAIDDAGNAMAEHGAQAMLVAGGTDLYPNMKRRQFEPTVLVGLRAIRELRGVRGGARDGVTIGACTTLSAVAAHRAIAAHYPALATAAGLVSSPQLRNMGTIGGNVCVDTRCNYCNQSYEWRKAVGFCTKKDGVICLVAPGSPRCWAVS